MAGNQAIAVTVLALRGLLANACPKDQLPGGEFRLFQTNSELM
jgi:hypothetical protein